jgi:hypothetical protein
MCLCWKINDWELFCYRNLALSQEKWKNKSTDLVKPALSHMAIL